MLRRSITLATFVSIVALIPLSMFVAARFMKRRTEIRYQPARKIPKSELRQRTDNVDFRVDESQLVVNLETGPVVLGIPDSLQNSASWRVLLSHNRRLLILSNERGLAVWDSDPPHLQRHVWAVGDEPLSGGLTGRVAVKGPLRFEQRDFDARFTVDPKGYRVCLHATYQNTWVLNDPIDGFVEVRDMSTGKETQRLMHPGWGQVVDKVVWSPDGTRLATYSSYHRGGRYAIWVWEIESARKLREIPGIFSQFHFSRDSSKLYVLTQRFPQRLEVYAIGESDHRARLASREISMKSFELSPDGRFIAAIKGGDAILLLDASTLSTRSHLRCPDGVHRIAFRSDSRELVATWFTPNEIFGSSSGVKAWRAEDGAVVLDSPGLPAYESDPSYSDDGAIRAGEFSFHPLHSAPSRK